jgi:hypothetical protein
MTAQHLPLSWEMAKEPRPRRRTGLGEQRQGKRSDLGLGGAP